MSDSTQANGPDDPACALIGVDWGTSSLRAYGMDVTGTVVRRHESSDGILGITNGEFGAHLERVLGPWIGSSAPPPIVLSGMITSRQGWVETPYLGCPAPASALAGALHLMRSPCGWPLHFVTGLSCRRADGTPDVMRGEETQILGAGLADGYLVMPGTHSKWVQLEEGAVREFTTFMTGEVFACLRDHTILGRLMTGDGNDTDAFVRGVSAGLDADSGLLARLFGVRSHGLFKDIPGDGLSDYLSGILIGTEFKEAMVSAGRGLGLLTLLGRGDLLDRYTLAASIAGIEVISGPFDTAARGQYLIAMGGGIDAMLTFEQAIGELPLIAILRGLEPSRAVGVAEGLVDAGFRIIEIPLNSPEPLRSIEVLARRFAGDVLIGAGTVLTTPAVQDVKNAGGRLIVMPHSDREIISAVRSAGLTCCPGVATPSEAFAALAAGADALKLFPAEAITPAVVKALRAVLPTDAGLFPVGGIAPESMQAYRDAGASGFGLGSALFRPEFDDEEIAARARRFVEAWG